MEKCVDIGIWNIVMQHITTDIAYLGLLLSIEGGHCRYNCSSGISLVMQARWFMNIQFIGIQFEIDFNMNVICWIKASLNSIIIPRRNS